jgi:AcrR family transcriptional regulator
MPSSPKRARDDDIAQILVGNGKILLRTGTPIEELTLASAAELAAHQKDPALAATLSQSRIYSRFRDLDDFRLAVLEELLDDGPRYSDMALNKLAGAIQEIGDGGSDVLRPEDVPELIADVAADHEREIRSDEEVALRLYAIWRLARSSRERPKRKLQEIRDHDKLVNEEWAKITETLAGELGAAPVSDTSYAEFEIALTALRTGLLVRQMTTELPEGILERLVGALILGLFAEQDEAKNTTIAGRLKDFFATPKMRRYQRREPLSLAKLEEAASESRSRLSGISDEDVDAATSPAVRRALQTLRKRGGRL